MSPDEIVRDYPTITHADIYAALAYYWDHRDEIEHRIGEMDLLIAATALLHDLTIVTRDRRHVERVPELKLYQDD